MDIQHLEEQLEVLKIRADQTAEDDLSRQLLSESDQSKHILGEEKSHDGSGSKV